MDKIRNELIRGTARTGGFGDKVRGSLCDVTHDDSHLHFVDVNTVIAKKMQTILPNTIKYTRVHF